jgi:hypothetical protein
MMGVSDAIETLNQIAEYHDAKMDHFRADYDFATTIRIWKGFVKPDGHPGIASKTYTLSDLDVALARDISVQERRLRGVINEINAIIVGQS